MGRARIFIVLAIAAIGAIGIALIVGMMTKHKPPPPVVAAAAPSQPMARVLVAKHDLAVGTRLSPNDVTWQDWPANAVNPAFITDGQGARVIGTAATAALADQASQTMHAAASVVSGGQNPVDQLSGSIVREVILTNEPITNAKLVRGGEGGFMAVVLHAGMRAMSVPVTAVDAAGGFVLPGDRVDLLMGHGTAPASLVLRNLQVLAVDQNSQQPKNGQQSQVAATATLEVASDDAALLVRAMATAKAQQSELILALRPYADANQPSGPPEGGENSGQVRILRTGQGAETVTVQ